MTPRAECWSIEATTCVHLICSMLVWLTFNPLRVFAYLFKTKCGDAPLISLAIIIIIIIRKFITRTCSQALSMNRRRNSRISVRASYFRQLVDLIFVKQTETFRCARTAGSNVTLDDKQIRYISCRQPLLADNSLFTRTRLDCFYSDRPTAGAISERVRDSGICQPSASARRTL